MASIQITEKIVMGKKKNDVGSVYKSLAKCINSVILLCSLQLFHFDDEKS